MSLNSCLADPKAEILTRKRETQQEGLVATFPTSPDVTRVHTLLPVIHAQGGGHQRYTALIIRVGCLGNYGRPLFAMIGVLLISMQALQIPTGMIIFFIRAPQ